MKAEEAKYEARKAIALEYADVFDAIRKAASMGYTELKLTDKPYTYEHKLFRGLLAMGYSCSITEGRMTVFWR